MDGRVCADASDGLQLIHAPLIYPFAASSRRVYSSVWCQITALIVSFYSLLTAETGRLFRDLTSVERGKKKEYFVLKTAISDSQWLRPQFPPGPTSEKILDPPQKCQGDGFQSSHLRKL